MNHKEHNGWYNYETWAVALWMDNEQSSQEYWAERAQAYYNAAEATQYCTKEEVAYTDLAELIEREHRDNVPALIADEAPRNEANVFTDLLNAAMSEVNWREIAKHLIDEVLAETQTK